MLTNTILPRSFYDADPTEVAPRLLGKHLVRRFGDHVLVGRIVEVEAYLAFNDPAAHNVHGKTARTAVLFGEAGYSYVYQIRHHHCLNIVTEAAGRPGCVLIRALEPVEGLDVMRQLRSTDALLNLASGPGKLCQAMHITRALNGADVTDPASELLVIDTGETAPFEIDHSPRIGITKAADWPLRFSIHGSSFISVRVKAAYS